MNYRPVYTTVLLFAVVLLPLTSNGQDSLVLEYLSDKGTFSPSPVDIRIKKNKSLLIKINNINPIYIQLKNRSTQYNYISNTPSSLKFIYPYPNNQAFESLSNPPNSLVDRQSLIYLNYLTKFIARNNQLHQSTQWEANPAEAKKIIQRMIADLSIKEEKDILPFCQSAQDYLLEIENHYQRQIVKWKASDGNIDSLIQQYAQIKSINSEIQVIDFAHLVSFLAPSIQENQDNFTSITLLNHPDIRELNLALYDQYGADTLTKVSFNIKRYGDISLDFSTGIFFTNLIENTYFLSSRDATSNYIKKEKEVDLHFSIGALAHISYSFLPQFKSGICLGTALSPFDQQLRYLLGFSAITGEQKQFVCSLGLSLAQLKKLSQSIPSDSNGHYLPIEQSDIPLVKRRTQGFFIGITYNLSKKSKI